LYEQLSIIKVFTNKTDHECHNIYKIKRREQWQFKINKTKYYVNANYYIINKGIKLFNQLSTDIKQMCDINKFKLVIIKIHAII